MADNNEESANANGDGAGESESSAANGDGDSGDGANGNSASDSAAGNTSGNTAVEAPPAGKTTDRLRNVMLFAVFPVLILFVAVGVVFALTDDSDDSHHKTSDSAFVSPAVVLDHLADGRSLDEISEITGVPEEELLHILANPRRNSDFPQNEYNGDGYDKDGYEHDFYYEDGHGKDGYEDDWFYYEDGHGKDGYEDTHSGEGERRELERGVTPFRDRVERFRDQHEGEGEGREPERGVTPFRDRVERFRDQHEGGHDDGGHDDGNQDDYSDSDRGGRAEIRRFGTLPDASIDDLLDLFFGFQDFDDREDSGFDGGNDRGFNGFDDGNDRGFDDRDFNGFDDGNDRDFDGNDRGETGSVEPGSEIDRGETGSEIDRRGEPTSEPIDCRIIDTDSGNLPNSLGLVGYFGIALVGDERLEELFGLPRSVISERTASGITLAEIAAANGVSEGQLVEALLFEVSERAERFGNELTSQERGELANEIRRAVHCPFPSPR